jgi:hypothetical protein
MDASRADDATLGPPADASSDASSGCTVDIGCGMPTTDPHNCGGCGHDCDGGACIDASCAPLPPQVLATGQASPFAIATDGVDVYWLNAGLAVGGGKSGLLTFSRGAVLKCSVSGCDNRPTLLAQLAVSPSFGGSVPLSPSALALDDAHVYFADNDGVHVCAKSGCNCEPRTLTRTPASALTLWDGGLAFVGGSADLLSGVVGECIGDLCSGALFDAGAQPSNLRGMTSTGGAFYWLTTLGRMYSCPIGGCGSAPTLAWTSPSSLGFVPSLFEVAAGSGSLYFTSSDEAPLGGVARCTATECEATAKAFAVDRQSATSIAVTGGEVIWSDGEGVVECPTGGCPDGGPGVLVPSATLLSAFAIDPSWIYLASWTDAYAENGTITRVAR